MVGAFFMLGEIWAFLCPFLRNEVSAMANRIMGYDGKHCGEIEMANKIVREIIHAKGIDIGIYTKDFENEYISLTDIAKYRNDNDPRFVIQNWMQNRNTVEFWQSGKNFTIRILTVCNSRRLEVRLD